MTDETPTPAGPTVRDLSASAAVLDAAVLAVQAASSGPALVALVDTLLTAVGAAAAAPPATAGDAPAWGALADDAGVALFGPDAAVLADGPPGTWHRLQVVLDNRALMVTAPADAPVNAPVGALGCRVRLIDGTTTLVDQSFPTGQEPVDHLDTAATVERGLEEARKILEAMPPSPLDDLVDTPGTPSLAPAPGTEGPATRGIPGLATLGAAAAAAAARRVSPPDPPPPPAPPVWAATHVVADGDPVPARPEPDADAAPDVLLAPGTPLRVLVVDLGWAQVDAANGWTSWLDAECLQSTSTPAPPAAWVATHTVTDGAAAPAWSTPNPTQQPDVLLAPGTPLRVLVVDLGWAQVDTANGWTSWLDARSLTLAG